MNDTLKYFSADAAEKRTMHEKLTFPMVYAFSEKHVLPFSHDEVVHGKFSLINRMKGSYEQKFEQLRLLFAYQLAHPGSLLSGILKSRWTGFFWTIPLMRQCRNFHAH